MNTSEAATTALSTINDVPAPHVVTEHVAVILIRSVRQQQLEQVAAQSESSPSRVGLA